MYWSRQSTLRTAQKRLTHEESDANKDRPNRSGNRFRRVRRLACHHADAFATRVERSSDDKDLGDARDAIGKGSWVPPIPTPDVLFQSAAKEVVSEPKKGCRRDLPDASDVDHESYDEEDSDRENLDCC